MQNFEGGGSQKPRQLLAEVRSGARIKEGIGRSRWASRRESRRGPWAEPPAELAVWGPFPAPRPGRGWAVEPSRGVPELPMRPAGLGWDGTAPCVRTPVALTSEPRVPCSRAGAVAAGWARRDSEKNSHPLTHPARSIECGCSFLRVCGEASEGRRGLVVQVSGFGCGRWARDLCLLSFNPWHWALHRGQPRSRDSLADWRHTPSNLSKCRNMKM